GPSTTGVDNGKAKEETHSNSFQVIQTIS
ncbi:unnamed protein product, partial [Rotaria sp. Silwood1]